MKKIPKFLLVNPPWVNVQDPGVATSLLASMDRSASLTLGWESIQFSGFMGPNHDWLRFGIP
jgi:hypothetical protein